MIGRRLSLADQLLLLRASAGLTAKQVADRLGWPVGRIIRFETGEVRPHPDQVSALAKVYECRPDVRTRLVDQASAPPRRRMAERLSGLRATWRAWAGMLNVVKRGRAHLDRGRGQGHGRAPG